MPLLNVGDPAPDFTLPNQAGTPKALTDLINDVGNETAVGDAAGEDASAKSHKRICYVIGPEGAIRKVYGTVKAAAHPEQVLRDLGG